MRKKKRIKTFIKMFESVIISVLPHQLGQEQIEKVEFHQDELYQSMNDVIKNIVGLPLSE
jgi:hypothetical protein